MIHEWWSLCVIILKRFKGKYSRKWNLLQMTGRILFWLRVSYQIFWLSTLWDLRGRGTPFPQSRIRHAWGRNKPKLQGKLYWEGIKGYFIHGSTSIGTQSQKNCKFLSHSFIEFCQIGNSWACFSSASLCPVCPHGVCTVVFIDGLSFTP